MDITETMEWHFIYFKSHSSFFLEFLTWRILKSLIFNSSLPRRFSLTQVRAKVGKYFHQQIVDNLCHHVFQLQSNTNNEEVLVLIWIKHVRIFPNKKIVYLITHNSTYFLCQTKQWTRWEGKFFSLPYN